MNKHILLWLLMALAQAAAARTDVPVTFMHDGYSMQARLTLPAGPAPYRVIVLAPGSGANDKDGTIPMVGGNAGCLYPALLGDTLRPYKGLAGALADAGYAVLTYDKLEYSYPATLGTITFHKLWLPVSSAIDYLKTRSDIDTANMVLLGHSEGSTLIPYIARSHPGVRALISLAGPRRSVYDTILAAQLRYISATCGGDTAQARMQGNQLMAYFSLIRSGGWNSSTPPFAGVPAAVWSDYIKVADSVVINYDLAARRTLFVGLGSDINVPIATELAGFRRDITTPANFYEVPGVIHYLTTTGNPATSRLLTDTLIYWLRQQVPPLAVQAVSAPAGGLCTITGDGHDRTIHYTGKLSEVTVYTADGKRIYRSRASGSEHRVLLDAPAPGIYMFWVSGSKGSETIKVKL